MKITFFRSPSDFRKWLAAHHRTAVELWVGFHKRGTGRPSITWPEAVDQALCFGWIDGVRKSVDETSYSIRFTPRREGSIWSAVNIKRVRNLREEGLMRPEGIRAFERRRENKSGVYSYEQRGESLPKPYEGPIKKNKAAWAFFQAQPPWYRKVTSWWVVSAKREETRLKRLAKLIEDSAQGRRIGLVDPKGQAK